MLQSTENTMNYRPASVHSVPVCECSKAACATAGWATSFQRSTSTPKVISQRVFLHRWAIGAVPVTDLSGGAMAVALVLWQYEGLCRRRICADDGIGEASLLGRPSSFRISCHISSHPARLPGKDRWLHLAGRLRSLPGSRDRSGRQHLFGSAGLEPAWS
jgi:hypothetical protein